MSEPVDFCFSELALYIDHLAVT